MPATSQLLEIDSKVRGERVLASAVLPPDFEPDGDTPLLISLHGGGGDRANLPAFLPLYERMFKNATLPPLVAVSFSSGPGSWYGGAWEEFVVDELPAWAAKEFGVSCDRDHTVLTGISMGGYGTLKIAFKHPNRFRAIAAMEPAIEPSLERMPNGLRNTWYRMPEMEAAVWGEPLDEAGWLADNPATVARDNAQSIRASGMEIYLEVGDRDYINLHDGAEFMHRVLWDHDIRHEYHLVRWADHVGMSMGRRLLEAHRFLGSALAGGREEPTDLPLTAEEESHTDWVNAGGMASGDPAPVENPMADPTRAPSVHARIWDALKSNADDPDMARSYARLPPTD